MKVGINFKANSVIQSSLIFTILTFLKPAINVFLLPFYLKILTPKEFGIYTIVITITTLVSAIGGLRISGAVVPFYYDCGTEIDKNKLLDTIISFIIISNVIFLFLIVIFGSQLFSLILSNDEISFFPYILIAVSTGLLSPIIQAYTSFIKNEKKIIKYAIIQLVLIIVGVVFQILLITYFKLLGALWANLLANFITTLLVLFFLRKIIKFSIDKVLLRKYLKFSIPLIPFFFIFWIGRYFDRFILEKYVDLTDIAVFGLLMTFVGLVSMASEALANSIQPFLFEAYTDVKKNVNEINQLFIFYSIGLIVFSSLLILIVSNIGFISPAEKYLEIIPYFYLAIIPALMNAIQYMFFNIYTYSKKSNRLAFISFVTVSVQVFLLLFLVREYQIYGAILASLIGNIFSLIWYSLESKKYMTIKYNWTRILPSPVVFFLCLFAGIYIGEQSVLDYRIVGTMFPIPVIGSLILIYYKDLIFLLNRIRKNG